MEILVLSDSHGRVDHMVRAVEQFHPRPGTASGGLRPGRSGAGAAIPPASGDHGSRQLRLGPDGEPERLLEIDGVRILMLHGHTRHVKSSPMAAVYAAREYGADVLLFGHTHVPLVDYDGALWVMNPGARRGLYPSHLRPSHHPGGGRHLLCAEHFSGEVSIMRYIGCHLSSSAGFAAMDGRRCPSAPTPFSSSPAIHGAAGPSP